MLIEIQREKTVLNRFQMKMNTIFGIELKTIHVLVKKNLFTLCPCPKTLREAKFKSDKLINLVGKISRLSRIQAIA
jgi:GTP cyclohydrolase FolE2